MMVKMNLSCLDGTIEGANHFLVASTYLADTSLQLKWW